MATVQITAKVNATVKKAFMQAAKKYDLPASSLLSMLMRMVAEGKLAPEISRVQYDDTHTAFYDDKDMLPVNEPIEQVIGALERMS